MQTAASLPVIGILPGLQPGEAIMTRGWWQNEPRHGWQFRSRGPRCRCPIPVSEQRSIAVAHFRVLLVVCALAMLVAVGLGHRVADIAKRAWSPVRLATYLMMR